ncbi:MAG: hypothetical protein AAGK78_01545 [Planctomycetota bacterium]
MRLIDATRNRLTAARVTTIGLAVFVLACLMLAPGLQRFGIGDVVGLLGLVAAGVWVMLGVRSAAQARRVREAAAMVNLGRADLAGETAERALTAFNSARPVTVGAAAVLARVRFSEGRFLDAAALASFVLSRREKSLVGSKSPVRLLMVESLLAAGLTPAAQAAMMPLYDESLDLNLSLRLLMAQLRIEARQGAWPAMMQGITSKVAMAELMPTPEAVLAHGMLWLGAERSGQTTWSAFLSRRVKLLGDPQRLVEREPALAGLASLPT